MLLKHTCVVVHYAYAVIKTKNMYMNCGIISVVVGIILSIMDHSNAQKHNMKKIKHIKLGLN